MNTFRIPFLNTFVDNLTMDETLHLIEQNIDNNKHIHHGVVNAGKIVAMHHDSILLESVNACNIINADGQAVVWGSKFLGKPIKERVAGIDLMQNLVQLSHEKNYTIYFLGAKDDVLNKVIERYSKKYSSHIIAGFRNGYFKANEQKTVAERIASSGANILFVAMSSPLKENFLYQNRLVLNKVNFIMGVGGSFDVVAGKVKRAPIFMQKMGMEWFYRFIQEPRRLFKRSIINNFIFLKLLLIQKLSKKK